MSESMTIRPVGYVRRKKEKLFLEIAPRYIPALKELEHFSYAQVLWWCNYTADEECRKTLQNEPPYDTPVTGVFASRSPVRPNPVALTTVKVLGVDHKKGLVEIAKIDAADDTPVVDIKPYIPVCDRVQSPDTAPWCAEWPDWMPEDGLDVDD